MVLVMGDIAEAQPRGFNYDESKVPQFELPSLLQFKDGRKVESKKDWQLRRQEIFRQFESEVFGRAPQKKVQVTAGPVESKSILGGTAKLEQVKIELTSQGPSIDLLILRPANQENVPAFLGLNFMGNHTVYADSDIWITESWVRNDKKLGATSNRAAKAGRGKLANRWSVDQILKAGYALVTVYYGDIDPDFDDGFQNGLHGKIKAGKTGNPAADEWGSIAAWAFGLSRVVDYLETNESINAEQVFLLGHSRLGKTALWGGATDPRYAGVISNNSGCGGAALSKRRFGETVKRINTSFPHWFCDNFNKYNDNEEDLPIDQHMLIALCAPTPVYVASASEDLWADPRGEFLSIKYASPVFELLTGKGLNIASFPEVNTPSIGTLSYHCRQGGHDVTAYDWANYIKFANQFTR